MNFLGSEARLAKCIFDAHTEVALAPCYPSSAKNQVGRCSQILRTLARTNELLYVLRKTEWGIDCMEGGDNYLVRMSLKRKYT